MDFSWNEEQQSLFDQIYSFAKEHLNADALQRDAEHRFGRREWNLCGEFGLLGLSIPTEYDGMGLDSLSTCGAVEAFSRGCEDTGLAFSASAHLFAVCMPIVEHASEEIKRRYLPGLATGKLIGANAITEAEAGSDAFSLSTRAVKDGDVYRLTGAKSYVSNGPEADVFLVYATTNPDAGYLGIEGFVVERDTPGLVIGEPFAKMGLTTSPISSIYLDEAVVPAANRIGAEGRGAAIFTGSMHWERTCLFASYVGQMERVLDKCIEQATTRRQYRRPIGKYQAISHRIADMKIRLEAARLLLYRACWLRDQGRDAAIDVAMAKIAVSEAAVQSGLDAIQIYGGIGYTHESGVERWLRDAVPSTIFSGTSEIQRNLVAAALGL